MIRKFYISLALIGSMLFLGACSNSSGTTVQGLPDLFSTLPDDFDQLLFIDVDDDVLDLVATQYGEATPIAQEFAGINTIVIWQKGSTESGENLLFVEGEGVDINQLAALGLVALDSSYQTYDLTDTIQVYGEKSLVESKTYEGIKADALLQEFGALYAKSPGNFNFITRPGGEGLQGLAVQFASQLEGTVGSVSIGNKLPTGEAAMLFKNGIVPNRTESWTARAASPESPVHVATYGLTELLGLDKTLVKTFLPLILTQYLGEGAALFTDGNYDALIKGLNGSISVDIVPSLIGMGGRLVIDDPTIFTIFDSLYPVLDGAVKTKMFQGTQIESVQQASLLSWNTQVPLEADETLALPLLSIEQTPDSTAISLLLVDTLSVSNETVTHPGDTLAVAQVDFDLLTQLMGVEAGELLQGGSETKLKLQMKSDAENNRIRILLN